MARLHHGRLGVGQPSRDVAGPPSSSSGRQTAQVAPAVGLVGLGGGHRAGPDGPARLQLGPRCRPEPARPWPASVLGAGQLWSAGARLVERQTGPSAKGAGAMAGRALQGARATRTQLLGRWRVGDAQGGPPASRPMEGGPVLAPGPLAGSVVGHQLEELASGLTVTRGVQAGRWRRPAPPDEHPSSAPTSMTTDDTERVCH